MKNLEIYAAALIEHANENPISDRRPQPEGINTLWVPFYSGRRTASINLNHEVIGFESGELIGENGNDCAPYVIIGIPMWFKEEHLNYLAVKVAEKLNKPAGYPVPRVLKASRIKLIKEVVSSMSEFDKTETKIEYLK